MARNKDNALSRARQVLDRLAVDRKKTVFAACLLTIMAFMWVRVFLGRRPSPAAADTSASQAQTSAATPPKTVRYIELPNISGRNDYINRDFFAAREWECFRQDWKRGGSGMPVKPSASNHGQELANRLVRKLQLEAVVRDETPRTFINDRWLRIGDRITVRDGPDTCEFEVLRIYEDSVLVGCNERQLTLKLTQHLDVSE